MWIFVRAVFHWKYSNWVIALFGGAALTAALADKFVLAYCFIAIAGIYSVGCWLTSNTLHGKCVTRVLFDSRGDKVYVTFRPWSWITIPSVLILGLVACSVFGVWRLKIDYELSQLEGWLYPANEPVNLQCFVGKNDLALVTGSNNLSVARFFPIP
jgi:hypothetical protein